MKERVERPKNIGMTMVIDTCVGLHMLRDVLQISNKYIDHWKCSYGVSAVMPSNILHQKLEMLNEHEINTFPGGTLLEAAIIHKNCQSYMVRAKEIGFHSVEISDGTITLPSARRRNVILCALENGLIPLTEVGKKDPANQPCPEELADQILQDLYWGAEYVIVDARESGCGVGIFDHQGEMKLDVFNKILSKIGKKVEQVIWEAPLKKQQVALIKHIGPNVNLGNVSPMNILSLESLRLGLQYESLHEIAIESKKSGIWDPEAIESNEEKKTAIENTGAYLLTTTHAFAGVDRGVRV